MGELPLSCGPRNRQLTIFADEFPTVCPRVSSWGLDKEYKEAYPSNWEFVTISVKHREPQGRGTKNEENSYSDRSTCDHGVLGIGDRTSQQPIGLGSEPNLYVLHRGVYRKPGLLR